MIKKPSVRTKVEDYLTGDKLARALAIKEEKKLLLKKRTKDKLKRLKIAVNVPIKATAVIK